jgi:hypothetical protein
MDRVSNRWAIQRWSVLAVSLVLLNLSLSFANIWPTLGIRLTAALSLEAAILVLLLVIYRARFGAPSARLLRSVGILWVVLIAGRYVDVTTRSLYGRDINLYWDLRLMPDVGAMLASVAQPLVLAAIVIGVIVVPLLVYVLIRWALGCVSDAAGDRWGRRVLAGLSVAVITVATAWHAGIRMLDRVEVAEAVTPAFARQARQLAYEMSGAGLRALPPAVPIDSTLAQVDGADVFLIFIESYGAVSWDRPEFAEALASSRAGFLTDIRDTARRVVSTRVESTTFGGESWLAHISFLSGSEVRDQDTNVRLMGQRRETLVTAFSREGYRTVAVMPGLQRAWPEGAFYGFDTVYGANELEYRGPPFGWWDITDQFALARIDDLVSRAASRGPLFVFFPTISTHTPFTPTPPYQADWSRMLTTQPYDPDVLDRAWSEPPDWLNLGPGYVKALDYIHATLGGYLRKHANRDLVLILIGDHQPPAAVSGEGASWDVPVHVIASRGGLVDRLLTQGFQEGLAPPSRAAMKINALLPVFLSAFGND